MTFCLGMKCNEGLLAIADTRITSGTEQSVAKKIVVHQSPDHSMFVLTSGLRSLRDKTITYFLEHLAAEEGRITKMYQAANLLSQQIRRVREEDEGWLTSDGLSFDIHCILGGQMRGDSQHRLYLLYPVGNWVEVGVGTPYVIIGESSYGKPTLDRLWNYEAPIDQALRDGLLAFDATRISASDVDYPIDCVLYAADSYQMHEHRFTEDDLRPLREHWSGAVRAAADSATVIGAPLVEALRGSPVAPDHIELAPDAVQRTASQPKPSETPRPPSSPQLRG